MAPPPLSLVLGNQMLLALDPNYPTQRRFRVRQHTVNAVADVVRVLESPPERWTATIPEGIDSALDVFAGYIMLDAWIANQDRHHENWGALRESGGLQLTPTFDHGAALARNLNDDERAERLATKDRNRTVAAFAKRGRSAFYREAADRRPLTTFEAFLAFAELDTNVRDIWLQRLSSVNFGAVWRIIEQIPPQRMSEVCKQFTLELLNTNQQRLLNLEDE